MLIYFFIDSHYNDELSRSSAAGAAIGFSAWLCDFNFSSTRCLCFMMLLSFLMLRLLNYSFPREQLFQRVFASTEICPDSGTNALHLLCCNI